MNIIGKAFCRVYQTAFKLVSYVLPWRDPDVISGADSLSKLPQIIKKLNFKSLLIVTDKGLMKLNLLEPLFIGLNKEKISFTVYDETVPNPTLENLDDGYAIYKKNNCDCIVAFGGGSPMDCAKGIGVRIVRPRTAIRKMKGVLKVWKRLPTIFAIPTTAGTGSEATLAAVITDSKTHEKYSISDLNLIPRYAVLDPVLTVKLPKHITSTTGMDAMTHAIESYIGNSNTKQTKIDALQAIQLIFDNLKTAYDNGEDLTARENMQKASYLAGRAFTRAYIGYVHAIAHTFGGFYNTPHGLANAVILPHVLKLYGEAVHKKLAEISDFLKLTTVDKSLKDKAEFFINAICLLNKSMGIPEKLNVDDKIKPSDFPIMLQRAMKEAHPLYPVPKILTKDELLSIYNKML